MNDAYHAVVWIDHKEAKIYHFRGDTDVRSPTSLQRLHHSRTGLEADGNAPNDTDFFERIIVALGDTIGTAITGPGNAKNAFKEYLGRTRPEHTSLVFLTEMLDQPNPDILLAQGRRYLQTGPTIQSSNSIETLRESNCS